MKLLLIAILILALIFDYMSYRYYQQTNTCNLSPAKVCDYYRRLP